MITMHFGMTGELEYYSPDRQERPRYARVIFSFEGGHRLAYISRRMLGRVGVADDMAGYIEAHDLGPDALAKDLDPKKFVERLQGHRGPIKSTLMNQQIIAGIGNEWGDEILYQAKLHPEAASDELDANRLKKLYRVMRRVLKTGARHGGDAGKLPRRYLLVHRDEGRCPACGARTEKVKVGGRSSYFCPKCQTK